MKEHALLLSTEMVLAFLTDRKYVTRRIPSPTNSLVNGKRVSAGAWNSLALDFSEVVVLNAGFEIWGSNKGKFYKMTPIYQPGDLLWFRETFGYVPTGKGEKIGYKADHDGQMWNKWRPSIHMPKEASRLWAEVTVCNCERLTDITEEQATNEGIDSIVFTEHGKLFRRFKNYSPGCGTYECDKAIESFFTLWGSIHGWDSWTANPPVYAINFNLLSKTGRPVEDAKNVSHE